MPAAFSGNRPGRRRLLLLLLLWLSLSGGSPADLTVTTPDTSQSQGNSLTKMHAGFNESSPALFGPGHTMQLAGHVTKSMSVVSFGKYELLLDGDSRSSMERHITLHSATAIELSCRLSKKYSHLKNPQVSWKRGNETIGNVNKIGNSWNIKGCRSFWAGSQLEEDRSSLPACPTGRLPSSPYHHRQIRV